MSPVKIILAFVLILLSATAAFFAQQKIKRRPGVFQAFGPVHTIREEQATFTSNNGEYVEGSRVLFMLVTYSEDGTQLDRIMYHGDQTSRLNETYDADGRIRERQQFDRRGAPTIRSVYTYDEQKHLLEGVSYRGDGSLISRSVYKRNGKRVQVETISYDQHGVAVSGRTNTTDQDKTFLQSDDVSYDARRSASKQTSISRQPDGSQEFKVAGSDGTFKREVITAEDKGTSERVAYAPDGTILSRERFEHEYDSYGNIVKTKTSLAKGDSNAFEPTRVLYRTFTYYGKD